MKCGMRKIKRALRRAVLSAVGRVANAQRGQRREMRRAFPPLAC
jgi:hypothetical protein